jgi:hypothetical protein
MAQIRVLVVGMPRLLRIAVDDDGRGAAHELGGRRRRLGELSPEGLADILPRGTVRP